MKEAAAESTHGPTSSGSDLRCCNRSEKVKEALVENDNHNNTFLQRYLVLPIHSPNMFRRQFASALKTAQVCRDQSKKILVLQPN